MMDVLLASQVLTRLSDVAWEAAVDKTLSLPSRDGRSLEGDRLDRKAGVWEEVHEVEAPEMGPCSGTCARSRPQISCWEAGRKQD